MAVEIHPTAIVAPGAELGTDVTVGPYSIIGAHVRIGDRSRVAAHVVIEGHTTLGESSEVFQFASIGSAPQDLKYKNEPTTLVIGAGNKIREYVTLQPGTVSGSGTTIIGDNNLFMASSHVAHDCRVGSSNVFANSVALAGHVHIGNRVILGGLSAVHQFVRVGDFAFLGGGSMVGKDVPPFTVTQGYPASLRGLNVIGMKRGGIPLADVVAVRRLYRHLFLSGRLSDNIASVPEDIAGNPRVQEFLAFIKASERGVCSGSSTEAEESE